eukprot:gnl/TRDRNA2_/TRDRNA2_166907_c2_seq9.p1 gnl/TRDRNA2_/TRDRNA2_166907_c2~~gnl/TRDRNA2_/TRDRNA2_166907_c2_seq9.p1  ORF type:complete len:356 (-),score=28.08 gnl/TRDRNA2_/TRDRNA2_166907_c2_seq9:290-1357(-)
MMKRCMLEVFIVVETSLLLSQSGVWSIRLSATTPAHDPRHPAGQATPRTLPKQRYNALGKNHTVANRKNHSITKQAVQSVCDRFNSQGFYVRSFECPEWGYWTSAGLHKKRSNYQIRQGFAKCMHYNFPHNNTNVALPTSFLRFDMPAVSYLFNIGFILSAEAKLSCAYVLDIGDTAPDRKHPHCDENKDYAKLWYDMMPCHDDCRSCKASNVRLSDVGCCHNNIESMARTIKRYMKMTRLDDPTCDMVHKRPVGCNQCQVHYRTTDVVGIFYINDSDNSRADARTLFRIMKTLYPSQPLELVRLSTDGKLQTHQIPTALDENSTDGALLNENHVEECRQIAMKEHAPVKLAVAH